MGCRVLPSKVTLPPTYPIPSLLLGDGEKRARSLMRTGLLLQTLAEIVGVVPTVDWPRYADKVTGRKSAVLGIIAVRLLYHLIAYICLLASSSHVI